MEKSIKKLSLRFLWGHKKQTQALITILSICILYSFFILNYKEASRLNKIETLSNTYGHFNQAVDHVDTRQVDKIMQHTLVDRAGEVRVHSEIDYPFQTIKLGSMDQVALVMLNVELQQGRMPLQENDIVLEEHIVNKLGYPHQLGITIELNQKNYTLVGIMKDYNENLVLPALQGIVVSNEAISYSQVYIQSSEEDLFSAGLKQQVVLNNIATQVTEGYLNEMIVTIYGIWFIVFMLVYSMFYLQVKQKISQFLLLRSIGASQKQIRKMIYYQGVYLFKISTLIGLTIGIVLFEMVCYWQFQTLYFNIGLTWLTLTYILLCLIIGLVLPAKQASQLSMSGHLEGKYITKSYKTVAMSIKNLNKRYKQVSFVHYYFQLLLVTCCLFCSFETMSYFQQVKRQQSNQQMDLYDFSIQSDLVSNHDIPPLSDTTINEIGHIAGIKNIQTIHYVKDLQSDPFLNIIYLSSSHQKILDYFETILTPKELDILIHQEGVIYLQYPSIRDKNGRSGINSTMTQKDIELMENVLNVEIIREDIKQVVIENKPVEVIKVITNIDTIKDINYIAGIKNPYLTSQVIRIKDSLANRTHYAIETTRHDHHKVIEKKLKQVLQPEYEGYYLVNHYERYQEETSRMDKTLQNAILLSVLGIGVVLVVIYTYSKGKSLEQISTWKTFRAIGMSKKMMDKMEYHWITHLYLKALAIVLASKLIYFLYHFYYGYRWGGQALLKIYLEWVHYPYLECSFISLLFYIILIQLYKMARKHP